MLTERLKPVTLDVILIEFISKINLSERLRRPPLLKRRGLNLKIDSREPFVKHIDGKIWELRPLRNRILFFGYDGNNFILLSHFIKKTNKTPQREIEKAKQLMTDYIERSENNEKL